VWRPALVVYFKAMETPKATLVSAEALFNPKTTPALFPVAITSEPDLWLTTISVVVVVDGVVIPLHFKVNAVLV